MTEAETGTVIETEIEAEAVLVYLIWFVWFVWSGSASRLSYLIWPDLALSYLVWRCFTAGETALFDHKSLKISIFFSLSPFFLTKSCFF